MSESHQSAQAQGLQSPAGPVWLIFYIVAIISTILSEYYSHPVLRYLPIAIFSSGLLLTIGFWIGKRSGQIAIITSIASIFLWSSTDLPLAALAIEVAKFNGTICLLISMPVMRMAFTHSQLHQEVVDLLGRVAHRRRMNVLLLSSVFTGLGLSFGTVGVLGASLEGRSNPQAATAGTIMRGIVITMLIAPTTGSVAVVMSTFPSIEWSDTLKLGIPLALAALFLGLLQSGHVNVTKHPFEKLGYAGHRRLGKFALISIVTTLTCHFGLSMSMVSAICSAALVTGCTWLLLVDHYRVTDFVRLSDWVLWRSSRQLTPEIALFLSCGLINVVVRQPIWQEQILTYLGFLNQPGLIGLSMIVLGVPLLTICGIHPMVPFSILAPIITSASIGLPETSLYTMWIVVFMLSMLLSPASVLNILTASSFNMTTWSLSVKAHALYAAAFAAIGIAVLYLSSTSFN